VLHKILQQFVLLAYQITSETKDLTICSLASESIDYFVSCAVLVIGSHICLPCLPYHTEASLLLYLYLVQNGIHQSVMGYGRNGENILSIFPLKFSKISSILSLLGSSDRVASSFLVTVDFSDVNIQQSMNPYYLRSGIAVHYTGL
jgi:hypothetical protein